MKKPIKICLACSLGGHLSEIMQLEPIYSQYNYFFLTEFSSITKELGKQEKIYFIEQIHRKEKKLLIHVLKSGWKTFGVLWKEKPDVIISTGAIAAIPACFIGKILRKKIIFIESFARTQKPSLSGKVVYPLADLFIVQWEPLLAFYPKAKMGGSIF